MPGRPKSWIAQPSAPPNEGTAPAVTGEAIHKCVVDGQVTYTNQACPDGSSGGLMQAAGADPNGVSGSAGDTVPSVLVARPANLGAGDPSQQTALCGYLAAEIARRSRGTPRIANRLLRRVRDYAEVKGDGRITKSIADKALAMLDVDPQGFDVMDRKLLEAVIHRFDGGPVGLDNIAASIGEERDTIEDVIEPYLIQQGYLQRTPRGRIATLAAYRHLGVTPPQAAGGLFSE